MAGRRSPRRTATFIRWTRSGYSIGAAMKKT
jgi:hypothetical protein